MVQEQFKRSQPEPLYLYGPGFKPLMNDAYASNVRTYRPVETQKLMSAYISPFKHKPRPFVPRGLTN